MTKDLFTLIGYHRDPGEASYSASLSMVGKYLDRNDLGKQSGGEYSPKSNALYYFRSAKRYGDNDLARKWLNKYYELGGTREGLDRSLKMKHPLSGIPKEHRDRFLRTLTPREREVLARGGAWWDSMAGMRTQPVR
jgi:hypothetical protein